MCRMSFAHTKQQMRDRTKTVTRRLGWKFAKVGMRVLAVSKARGLKKGEKPEVFGVIEFVEVSRRALQHMTQREVEREGFPELTPAGFVAMFCEHMRCTPDAPVTRIAFRHVCPNCDQVEGIRVDGRGSWLCVICGAWRSKTKSSRTESTA